MICFFLPSLVSIKRWLRSPRYVTTGLGPHKLILLLLNPFFQGTAFGEGLNVVPGNLNVITPNTLPRCRAPRGLASSSCALLVLHWALHQAL